MQCRPFYVTGLANRPGAYPYLPGFTVMHAVSVAGGLYRAPASSVADSMREKRILTETMDKLAEAWARKARLEAGRDGAATIQMPAELAQMEPERAAELIASEAKLLERNREVTKRERSALENVIALTRAEVDSYRSEIERTEKRIAEQKAIHDQLKELHIERVINQQRLFEAVAALDAAQRDRQTAIAGLARAKGELEKAEKELALLTLSASARAVKEIAEADREIARLKIAAAETQRLIAMLDTLPGGGSSSQAVSYRIVRRQKSGELTFVEATETTPIMPGDIIQIEAQNNTGLPGWAASARR